MISPAAGSACGQGTIQYVDINPDLFMFSAWTTRNVSIDLDVDITLDAIFQATPNQFEIFGSAQNRVVGFPAPPPDSSRGTVPLPSSYVIASSLQPQHIWADTVRDPYTSFALGAVFMAGFETITGSFAHRRGYVGLEFQSGQNTHYGWIQVDCETFSNNGGYVFDYAYELRPNTPILAGEVPEPSTWTFLTVGGILFCLLGRRNRTT